MDSPIKSNARRIRKKSARGAKIFFVTRVFPKTTKSAKAIAKKAKNSIDTLLER